MDWCLHDRTAMEQRRPERQAAIESRNYKHITAQFPVGTSPAVMEHNTDDPALPWILAACPYSLLCTACGCYAHCSNVFVVAVDGACSDNGTCDARAAILVFFGPRNSHHLAGILDYDPQPTSQKAEISAAIKALEIFRSIRDIEPRMKEYSDLDFVVKSDSAYLVSSMTEYIFKWKQNRFRTAKGQPMKNKDLFTYLDELLDELTSENRHVFFWHVPREYNEQADSMAKAALNARFSDLKVYIVAPNLFPTD